MRACVSARGRVCVCVRARAHVYECDVVFALVYMHDKNASIFFSTPVKPLLSYG